MASGQAEIRWEGNHFVVYDVGGGEELYVSFSGNPSQEMPVIQRNALKAGSTLRVGSVVFRLEEL